MTKIYENIINLSSYQEKESFFKIQFFVHQTDERNPHSASNRVEKWTPLFKSTYCNVK